MSSKVMEVANRRHSNIGGYDPVRRARTLGHESGTVPSCKGVRPLCGAVNVIATKFAVSVAASSSNDLRDVSVVMVELVFSRAFTRVEKGSHLAARALKRRCECEGVRPLRC